MHLIRTEITAQPVELLMTTLDQLPLGSVGRVVDVTGEDAIAYRLLEMGVTDAEELRVIAKAPLGDPVEYEIRGYRLSLRLTEARRVQVDIVSTLV